MHSLTNMLQRLGTSYRGFAPAPHRGPSISPLSHIVNMPLSPSNNFCSTSAR